MTTGIYQLNFGEQAYYIGKSVDIETRWKQHTNKFLKRTAAQQMQYAYDQLGMPRFGIVTRCHKDYLDILEGYYINIQNSYPNCLNTSIPKLDPTIDYEWLITNKHMLEFSSMSILGDFVNTVQAKIALEEEYETLQHSFNKEFMIHKAAADLKYGKDENAELVKQYHDRLRNAQEKVSKLLNRGLFDRIFNHQ